MSTEIFPIEPKFTHHIHALQCKQVENLLKHQQEDLSHLQNGGL